MNGWAEFVATVGLGFERTAADVAAAEAGGPIDAVDRGVGALAGAADVAAESGDAEHAAAIGNQPLIVAARAGMKDLELGVARCRTETADLTASLRLIGIALSRHHHAQRSVG